MLIKNKYDISSIPHFEGKCPESSDFSFQENAQATYLCSSLKQQGNSIVMQVFKYGNHILFPSDLDESLLTTLHQCLVFM